MNLDTATVTTIATVALAIVTVTYVVLTYKILNVMKKQAVCDIKINVKDCRSFIELIYNIRKRQFELLFDVYNQSSASGTITKPVLVLEYPDKGKEKIEPDFKEILDNGLDTFVPIIHLSGGQMFPKVLKYHPPNDSRIFTVNPTEVKCSLEFKDNLNREFSLPIDVRSGDYIS